MKDFYKIYLVSDSTGETLDRIFLAIKAQFPNFLYTTKQYSFVRTENQIENVLEECEKEEDVIILYTIVDTKLAKFLTNKCEHLNLPCFGILGNLIMNFSKLLNQKATHQPSGQHALDDKYYNRIEAIQFTMSHDDGKMTSDIEKSDIVLLGISRTSKTPTSIYLANRGYKTSNIALVKNINLPKPLLENNNACIVGLVVDPDRLLDVRKNRMVSLKEKQSSTYINIETIREEIDFSKKLFKKHKWPIIDVTRKSVEETAASVIKIYEILKNKNV